MSLYHPFTKFFDCLRGKCKNIDKGTIRCTKKSCFHSLKMPVNYRGPVRGTLSKHHIGQMILKTNRLINNLYKFYLNATELKIQVYQS